MLKLSRYPRERIVLELSDGRVITIQNLWRSKIMLGIDAPDDVAIVREEIYQPKKGGAA